MKILFIAPPQEDYLSDGLLHGLKSLFGASIVDSPKATRLYNTYPNHLRSGLYGKGFTLYCLLPDLDVDRRNIEDRLKQGEFQAVIIGSVQRDVTAFAKLYQHLDVSTTLLIDGEDTPAPYPYLGKFWRLKRSWFSLPSPRGYCYLKRELTSVTYSYRAFRLVPPSLCRKLPKSQAWKPIGFSIPEQHIVAVMPKKIKMFARHVVDASVVPYVPDASSSALFDQQADYYEDLRQSRFAVTARRAGWDCLRHYEIAANGCVPCFRQLGEKEANCAPHGLSELNCITYQTPAELFHTIGSLSDASYEELQRGAIAWARLNSTSARAQQVVNLLRAMRVESPQPNLQAECS